MAEPLAEQGATASDTQDEGRLAQFGYKQELRRDWGLLHNFGVSFSIIVCFFFNYVVYYLNAEIG
jgi:hypothetical protein